MENPCKKIEIVGKDRIEDMIHPDCKSTGKCQETEGLKGTPHEGISVCDDGCVWYNPNEQ